MPAASGRWTPMLCARLVTTLALGALLIFLHFRHTGPPTVVLAVVTTLTGPDADRGREALRGAQLYARAVNQTGGIDGHRLQLRIFDERGEPARARQIAQQVAAGPALLVIGPYSSTSAEATRAIYAAARIPAITAPSLAAPAMPDDPYAFSLRAPLERQGNDMATYAQRILGFTGASIISTDDVSYGRPLAQALARGFAGRGALHHLLTLALAPGQDQRSLTTIVTTLRRDAHPGVVFLAMAAGPARETIVALRRHGITAPIICGDACAGASFAASFAGYPEERQDPGSLTDGIYAAAPLIYDSAPGEAQALAYTYQQRYGTTPEWQAAAYYEAAQVAVAAMQTAGLQYTAAARAADRLRLRDQLAAMNDPESSVATIDGAVYFDRQHDVPLPMRFGQFEGRRFISTPIQFVPVAFPDRLDIAGELRAGAIMPLDGGYVWIQRVVYAGISINAVNSVDIAKSTFSADCFFWLRFRGPPDVTDVSFPDANGPLFDHNAPIRTGTVDGLQYRLYHLAGTFTARYDFHDYPFDRQQLAVRLQNPRATEDQVVYAIDALGLRLQEAPIAIADAALAFQPLNSWQLLSIQYLNASLTNASTLGDPRLYDQHTLTEYSGIQVLIILQRTSLIFVIKHVLPLMLFALVQYVTLFFPLTLGKERVVVPVTALVAGTVLLTAVNGALPEIGYPVAIEYSFYVFFALSLACIVTALLINRIHKARPTLAHRIDLVMRATYTAVAILVIAAYLMRYGSQLA